MNTLFDLQVGGLDNMALLSLMGASFLTSFMTISLGIGGGALLLAIMASLMPPAALIPVHGVIQLGSNVSRAGLLIRHMNWAAIGGFSIGSVVGVALGGLVVVELPGNMIQIGVGLFVMWSVLMRPPRWLSAWPWLTGALSSFLTMFFGATGLFVANYSKSLQLPRQAHVATHAGLMTVQHLLKIVAFGVLGFSFSAWLPFVVLMIISGLLGTLVGRSVLLRITDTHFKRALDVVLILISLRLIWNGLT